MRAFLFFSAIFSLALLVQPSLLLAQSAPQGIFAASRAELETQLQALEAQIAEQRTVLEGKQRERVSLERDVAILDARIEEAKLSIRARDLSIQKLTADIASKQKTIGVLSEKLDKEKDSLSQIIRKSNEMDSFSLPEIILSGQSFSEFFADVTPFTRLKEELRESFRQTTDTRTATEAAKIALEEQRAEETELRKIQTLQKQKLDEEEKKKQNILKASKGEESRYQKILAQTEQSATAIRAALFNLQGTEAIPFDKAYQYAKEVESRLGVRAAFLLGIIAEESNLGKNVGKGNWLTDMHPTRDRPVFAEITRELGLDPDKMPVSKKPWYGWGGAMGPAQFIPSTWVLYKDRIATFSGHNPPSPWNAYDSFIAAGILLKDNGAGKGTRAAERLAALRYLAGWKNAGKAAYAFYGDEVMELADYYQQQINILEGK